VTFERLDLHFAGKHVGNELFLVIAFKRVREYEVWLHNAIERRLVALGQRSRPFIIR